MLAPAIDSLESRTLLATFHPTFRLLDPLPGEGKTPAVMSPAVTYTGSQLRKAYGIDTLTFNGTPLDGTGQTIAIVDAYNAPTIEADLAAFNTLYGLPSAPLVIRNQTGGTTRPPNDPSGAGDSWAIETALDVEWAHAFAPKATILLVLANSNSDADLLQAVDYARNYPGVSALSMSYGADEDAAYFSSEDSHYTTPAGHAGVTFFSSSGDAGAYSYGTSTKIVGYPAASPNVVGVGGTNLVTNGSGNYSSETGWGSGTSSGSTSSNGGSGGGISQFAAKPSYQSSVTQSATKRTVPDVSYVADPATGVGVIDSYDNSGSFTPFNVGGTSLSSPLWAGLWALVNQARALNGLTPMDGSTQALPALYNLPASDFHDITSGNNGYAASAGYDLVTGRGTPIAQSLVSHLASTAPTIGGFAATPGTIAVGTASVTLNATNVVSPVTTVSSVGFWLESNGTAGLQTTGTADTFITTGSASGNNYSAPFNTAALAIGNYTLYAVATDTGAQTTTATATLVVNNGITSGAILGWDVNGQTTYGTQGLTANTIATGLTNSTGLTRGAGVTVAGTAAQNAWGGNGWKTTSALGISGNSTITFGTTVQSGYTMSLSSIDLYYRKSTAGPTSGLWQYQLNSGSWVDISDLSGAFTSTSSAQMTQLSLGSISALQNLAAGAVVNFRLIPYAPTNTGGNFYVYNSATAGDDLVVSGSVSVVSGPPLTVSGGVFSDETNPIHASMTFSGNVSASLAVSDFVLTDRTTSAVIPLPVGASIDYNAGTNVGTLNLGTVLASGKYRLTLPAGSVNAGTSNLASAYTIDFDFQNGDTNHDGTVNFADLLTLAANYGGAGKTRSTGDLDLDGATNFNDLLLLAANYNATLAATPTFASSGVIGGGAKDDEGVKSVASDVL
ncbi:MAG: hypothetical protein QM770_06570 [Tepidisphaeraceae bacterium]